MAKKPIASLTISSFEEPKGYEGSAEDWRHDYNASRRKGISTEQYEDSAEDRIADKAGEKRHRAHEASEKADAHEAPAYRPGGSHFKNTPKQSSGYGHKGSQRQGALRMSGAAGAHRIGGKK